MNVFSNKRMLLLGGSNNIDDLLEFQRKTGIQYIATTDVKYMDAPLRKIALEAYEVSPLDKDGLIKLITDKKIDAIFGGANEDIVIVAMQVAEECKLPFYVTMKQWNITANKVNFKNMCREYNIPVVKEYSIEGIKETLTEDDYPIIIKPVDACGSRGVVLCENRDSVDSMMALAMKESHSGRIIVEKYMQGTEIVAYYTLNNGEISLSSVCDRYNAKDSQGLDSLPDAYQYPSKYTHLFIEKYDNNIRRMLTEGLGLKNGVLGIQGFACEGDLTFFEMGYRLGGTSQYRYTKAINGISNFESLLAFGVTGKMDYYPLSMDNALFTKPCCTLTVLSKPGLIGAIQGVEEINQMKQVICTEVHYKVGDEIKNTHSLSQMIFWVFIIGDTISDLKTTINLVKNTIKVTDVNGQNMIISDFDPERLQYNF